jgi:hypothetical protein
MSANSETSIGRPLCYCGILAVIRYSWTYTNYGRKWYGCETTRYCVRNISMFNYFDQFYYILCLIITLP